MTDLNATELASQCAQAMLARDRASLALGMQLLSVAPGRARLSMPVRADMIQGHGTCHGGYIFTLADSAFAVACNTYNQVTIGLGCSIDYIAPALMGDTLNASCVEQSRGGRTGNYDVRVENQNGQLIALFHGKSYKVQGTVLAQETADE
ncbi:MULTISPECIES: hydroxyphenylacetyl-CoA thioesterase PaaI [Pseudomonas]|jgi:acyl-CoA thioesterase|uniref:Acyl-CoA thioesterase n=2 Tax=Pseudomonas TaxID=286 RepID=A0A9X8HLV3_PSEPU|nr:MULTISPECIES: hydroxyphenylacetyl-CoA thioesterase PaaI [Pseudomonas]KIU48219.1 phenylacetic acid degradation protein [Pseudomonas putida]KTC22336.1 phenylacetic acid degradation protein [Pseudomonas putida]MBG8559351.1 hydroxyphenylacetyl-CoA thioesterase PaaI [Pseudomonas qingdaonensis]MCO7505672.1 hydroxyphenylacetyl-CoA thioesterase PaaI [Pseudomonas sp. VE 267-6A]MCO7533050.1 hydroxyphenylacetyl-CoA thioesterase PaaI [Pseudomonas sp. 2]